MFHYLLFTVYYYCRILSLLNTDLDVGVGNKYFSGNLISFL